MTKTTETTGSTAQRVPLQLVPGGGAPEPDAPARPSRARSLEIDGDATLGRLVEATLAECLRHVEANRAPALSVDDPEGVHQLRVAVRRTRSALRLFRRALHRDRTKALRAELRWIADRLGAARDWDVFVTETLAPIAADRPDDPGLRRLAERAEARRRSAHDRVREALASERAARLFARLERYVLEGGFRPEPGSKRARRLERPARRLAVRLLEERLERVDALGGRIERLPVRDLHRLRIRVKQLRYAAGFFAALHPAAATRKPLERMARLQDELGRVNDGRVAEALVEALVEGAPSHERPELERAAGIVIGWSHRGAARDRRLARRVWKRFARTEPFWASR